MVDGSGGKESFSLQDIIRLIHLSFWGYRFHMELRTDTFRSHNVHDYSVYNSIHKLLVFQFYAPHDSDSFHLSYHTGLLLTRLGWEVRTR